MEVILLKDLKRKGTFGDTVTVANGYAVNYLIPNGFAISATPANKKRFEEMKAKAFESVKERRESLSNTVAQIKGKTFTIVALSRDGKLYGSITPSLIIDAIKQDLSDISINASDILIEEGQIKFVGTYQCKLQLTRDISSTFTIVVEADEADEQPELLESIIEDESSGVSNEDDIDPENAPPDAEALETQPTEDGESTQPTAIRDDSSESESEASVETTP